MSKSHKIEKHILRILGEKIDKEFNICVTLSGITDDRKPVKILNEKDQQNR